MFPDQKGVLKKVEWTVGPKEQLILGSDDVGLEGTLNLFHCSR